jgi:hypothetical protein
LSSDVLGNVFASDHVIPAPVLTFDADQGVNGTDLLSAYETAFRSGDLSKGLAKVKVFSSRQRSLPTHRVGNLSAEDLAAAFGVFADDPSLVDLMPLSGIEPLIHDKMYRLWRGTDDRSQSIRAWLSEWDHNGLLRSPEADLGGFLSSWWAAVRRRGRAGAKDDPGQPDLADLCFSLTKVRHGEADLCVRTVLFLFPLPPRRAIPCAHL